MNVKNTQMTDTKIALLLVPDELEKSGIVLQSLHITKVASGISYSLAELNRREVTRYYDNLTEETKTLLLRFGPEALEQFRQQTGQRYKKQMAGIPVSAFMRLSLYRHIHQQFQRLIPQIGSLRCYHKIRKRDSKAFQSLPCSYDPARPCLHFEVIKKGEDFSIQVQVELGDFTCNIYDLSRSCFLLEKENRYYLLSFADYQTLEWLNSGVLQQYGTDEALFMEHILSRLEKAYSVNRNNLFTNQEKTVLPSCRILLTELNNSFLLLTPQFLYDGIVVEGPFREKQEVSAGSHRVVIIRHRETESNFLIMLSALHSNFSTQLNGYYYLTFAEAQKKGWFINTCYLLMEKEVELIGMDMLHHFKYSPFKAETKVEILNEMGSFVHLSLSVTFGKETIPLSVLQKTLWAGQRAVVLRDGILGILNDEWIGQYGLLIKHGRIQGKGIEVSKFLVLSDKSSADSITVTESFRKEWWEKWQRWQSEEISTYPLPFSVQATLRPYQQKGFEWLVLLSEIGAGACLADDMGLGKTLQTICFLTYQAELDSTSRHLVVCPTSLIYNWQKELEKFAPSLSIEVYYGNSRSEVQSFKSQVIITSYGTLRNNSEIFASESFGVAVLDESHYIKNPSAQITRIALALNARIRIALSGTPVVNNTFDLYCQLSFALLGLFGSREFFKREYADPIDRWGDEGKIKTLQRLTAPFVLRRTKEQVAPDLPSKMETVLWCTMSPSQQELYDEIKDQIRGNLFMDIQQSGLNKAKLAVLQGLLKLRQVCNDPQLLPADEHNGRIQSIKTELLMEELESVLRGRKVLVFSQFASMLQLLAIQCEKRGIPYFLLDGSTPAEKRAQMTHEFQESEASPRLYFISLKAGGTGLTLTAADYVFLFDPWWNRAAEQQAVDRTHRIGQTKNVFSYKLICKNTVEEKIMELQNRKKLLADELISEEGFVKTLSEEDIDYLFT